VAYSVEITSNASEMLNRIRDRRIRRLPAARIDNLAVEPQKQGSPLGGLMAGYRSCRAVGQRYRIVYRIDNDKTVVIVGAIGIRRAGGRDDVYALAERLARLGLL
jgi:mRNA interferase RelE/StbE